MHKGNFGNAYLLICTANRNSVDTSYYRYQILELLKAQDVVCVIADSRHS